MTWRAYTRRLAERVTLMVGRGPIRQSDDTQNIQILQVELSPLELGNFIRASEYGFASLPPDNCRAVLVFNAGDRSKGIIIATHDIASRFKLANKGEAAIFDNSGPSGAAGRWLCFKLGDTPTIELEANNTPVNIKGASQINVTPPDGGTTAINITTGGENITLNMGGGNVQVNDPGQVVLGPAGKKVVMDGDAVVGGHVVASQDIVFV